MIYPLDLFLRTLAQLHHRHNRSQIQFVSINEYCSIEQAMNKVGHQQCHHNRKQNAAYTVESAVNQITTRSQILAEQDSKCC